MKREVRILRLEFRRVKRTIRRLMHSLGAYLQRKWALFWHTIEKVFLRQRLWMARYRGIVAIVFLLSLFAFSAVWVPTLQGLLEPGFTPTERLQGFRTLLQTVGGALLGATAIVSSLVLFSMQVNVERMPHGLFRRLSVDHRLLSAFAVAFLLAIVVAALSLIPDENWIGVATFAAAWATAVILILFLYAYRRALVLVNPSRQLEMIVARCRRDLRAWVGRARRAAPLLSVAKPAYSASDHTLVPKHDLQRLSYFRLNPGWTESAVQAVRYAASFGRRYAEQGDHEVSAVAMNSIVATNAAYVEAKGKTFFTYHPLLENPLTTDGFINETLEQLRQSARIGVARGDEQQVEQTLRTLAALVHVYASIDYCDSRASKTHAHLAVGYLTTEVEKIIPHNMPDVLMEGARLIRKCAELLLVTEGPDGIRSIVQRLGFLGCCGAVREDHRPVTLASVEQLAGLAFDLLHVRSGDIKYTSEEIRSSMSLIAKVFLAVPDTPISSSHSTYLGPYYSATSTQALSARLVELVNAVAEASADDKNARQIVGNIDDWADGLYRTEKELLLEAIKRKSQFTFDVISWIGHVTSILLAVSNAPACDDRTRSGLRKSALWLISVLSFVPDDVETVKFVESFQMTERLFEAALDAYHRDCQEIASDIAQLLVSWMFKGGQYHSGWAILERAIYGTAVLALAMEEYAGVVTLKTEVSKRLAEGGLPDEQVRDAAALEIRGRAETLYRKGHWGSSIENAMASVDHQKLKPLLNELADLISPGTVGQSVGRGY